MKKAFWICLGVYVVGVTLMLWLRQTGALTEDVWNFDTNTWHPRPSFAGEAVDNLRVLLDLVGLAALLSGTVLLWRKVRPQIALPAGSGAKMQSVAGAIDKRLVAIPLAVGAAFFIASAFQTGGRNWADQVCEFGQDFCIHPEWIAVGIGLAGLALYVWRLQK